MNKPYVTIYTKENGKQEFTVEEYFADPESGTLHRADGPAREWADKSMQWYMNGKLHRIDGPATEWLTLGGQQSESWYIEGRKIKKEDHAKLIQEVKDMPLVLRLVDPRRWVREYRE